MVTEISRLSGNTSYLGFSASSGLIIKPVDGGESVLVQYFYHSIMYDKTMYEEPTQREIGQAVNPDTNEFETAFYYGGQAFFLSEFMREVI
jgi:hypothetical protein